ncbi:protein angel homolog 2-like [Patiria miniata]|uniref:Endonuclease/exonuclease/phosphatase domain-containing protein n=1 Tax=Patiria miniata TaxID=46514 RepID=A0A913Z211_PATMI|nr:protein angel homolog 2-like [Patiria miniata]XP_038045885.1 protein angel homolog 2-like [Patiria miniata]XP_038045889.1 protein angel homolog 2-like [Patiria miniata]
MFSPARFASESARRTRQLSFPEQLSRLILTMAESSRERPRTGEKTKETYPNCFPPPLRSSASFPGVQQNGAPVSWGSESFLSGRPSTGFPAPPAFFARSYHASFPSLPSGAFSSSANGYQSVRNGAPGEQSKSKRTMNSGSVDSKKLCSDSRASHSSENRHGLSSVNRQGTKEEGTKITSGDGRASAEPHRSDMLKFKRRWTSVPARESHSPGSGTEVSVMSYNVLAQCLIETNDYLYQSCPAEVLRWDYRKEKLLKELRVADADIMCLQEVQFTHFCEFFSPELEKLGYAAVYQKRTGDKHDGCALFYKKDKFALEKFKKVRFFRSNIQLLDRDNVGIIALLRAKGLPEDEAPRLCVATTHLLYNPKRGDIKLAQLGVLLAEVDRMAAAVSPLSKRSQQQQNPLYHPIILCGDFNSLPHSPLYNFIRNRKLDYVGLQKVLVSGQGSSRRSFDPLNWPLWPYDVGVTDACQFRSVVRERLKNMEKSDPQEQEHCSDLPDIADLPQDWEKHFSDSIHHPFPLESVHYHDGDVREVTTNHSRTNCTVDYIFFSSSATKIKGPLGGLFPRRYVGELRLLEYLSLLTDEEASDMGGLPNYDLSSDHFSLQAKFLLTAPE